MTFKKHSISLILGILIGSIVTASFTPVIADTISKTIEVLLNDVNIKVNDTTLAKQNEIFTLANGEKVPYSILYKGTTYLPIRKVAEAVGKEVTWNQETKTAGINDKVNIVDNTNKEKKEISINYVKKDGKYYELSSVLGENFYKKTNIRFNEVNDKLYLSLNNESYFVEMCSNYINLVSNRYKISQGHDNKNLYGRIELNDFTNKYYSINNKKEYDGFNIKTCTLTHTYKLKNNKELILTFIMDSKYNYLERKSNPQNIYVSLDNKDDFSLDLQALHDYLGVAIPKIYYDEEFKCYILELSE
ncbi:MAG TPA: hypothetical protein DC000_03460 [Clostridiales bacterium]|nr:hypothetical protein [Clostridiales bacterium]